MDLLFEARLRLGKYLDDRNDRRYERAATKKRREIALLNDDPLGRMPRSATPVVHHWYNGPSVYLRWNGVGTNSGPYPREDFGLMDFTMHGNLPRPYWENHYRRAARVVFVGPSCGWNNLPQDKRVNWADMYRAESQDMVMIHYALPEGDRVLISSVWQPRSHRYSMLVVRPEKFDIRGSVSSISL